MTRTTDFLPDWVCPPGATIRNILTHRGRSISEFAVSMGISQDSASQLLNGSIPLTVELAELLSNEFGVSAEFWLCRESQFRDGLLRLEKNETWLHQFPINDLIRFNWIQSTTYNTSDKVAACLQFFGVATVADWWDRYEGPARLAAFRTSPSFDSVEGAVLAWLRKGELDAAHMDCNTWDPHRFRVALSNIRVLTRQKDPSVFIPELQKQCAECGVAVVIARAPSGCRASGATRFLYADKALLMLSFRYLSDDHFWFSFFHEAGHLLLHNIGDPILEGEDMCSGLDEEEANQFSYNMLIPPEHQSTMRALPVNGRAVMRFARKIGVSPGIVVGQLQHHGIITQRQLNNLKTRYCWPDD